MPITPLSDVPVSRNLHITVSKLYQNVYIYTHVRYTSVSRDQNVSAVYWSRDTDGDM